MKLTRYLISPLFILILFSCESGVSKKKYKELEKQKQELEKKVSQKDSLVNDLASSFNSIERNLSRVGSIRDTVLFSTQKDIELRGNEREEIEERIKEIDQLMTRNEKMIEKLQKRVQESAEKNRKLENMIANLRGRVERKNQEILELEKKLAQKDIQLKELYKEYRARVMELDSTTARLKEKDEELHKGYYAYGTFDELEKKGIVKKEGGIIGIGAVKKLKENLNKDYFEPVDIRDTDTIPLMVRKAEVVSTHPDTTFMLTEKDGDVQNLVIEHPKEFWSISKYLVVVVKN